jgi:hypothetical protein
MKRFSFSILLSVFICVASAFAQQNSDAPLTNASVVKLVKAGFKDKTVIAIIGNRPNLFNLDPDQLIELKRQGVSENIILAMLSTQDPTYVLDGEEWANDAFFKGLKKPSNGGDNDNGGTSIFGSSGSSQSQTQTRSGNGGGQNDGNVSGSATVRILKPPAEAGGAATPKLEKTPTLTNEGVIQLVEAGFSEGTIIKRIETSPVEFDLSPGKIAELYKRRVTDAIIAAMSAAMSSESRPN